MRRANSSSAGRGKKSSSNSAGSQKGNFKRAPSQFPDNGSFKKASRKNPPEDKSARENSEERDFTNRGKGKGKYAPKKSYPSRDKGHRSFNDDSRKASQDFSGDQPSKKKFRKADSNADSGEKRSFKQSYSAKRKSHPTKSGKENKYFNKVSIAATLDSKVSEKIRLNKYIANSGVCSRREADQLIQMGLVSVNGKVVTELGFKVNPTDEVRYEDKLLRAEKPVYILLNKPKGYLTTTSDPQERDTIMHLIGSAVKERVYPVGRLDRNTTGLLLITNDGDLNEKLSHPSYNVKKIYKVELDRPLTKADVQKILDGVLLEEGRAPVDDLAVISEDGRTVGLEIHIGWNRVVRRIFEALNYQVVKLDRSVYAGLDKKDLPRGKWRFLRKEEVIKLKHFK